MKVFSWILVLLFFTSCALQDEGLNLESEVDADECAKSGSQNCIQKPGSSNLELLIQSSNPIESRSSSGDCNSGDPLNPVDPGLTTYCFDVSGDCNEGNNETALVVLRSSPFTLNGVPVLAACKRGKFHAQLRINLTLAQLCVRHSLELELIGKDIDDKEETNPSKARKFIDILVKNHSTCLTP